MTNASQKIPSYQELLARTDAPAGSSWNLFGEGDQLGTLNFLGEEEVRHAATLIKRGDIFNLDYHINAFVPSISPSRKPAEHHIFQNNPNHRDDWLDSFYLQSTSQIDGLRHMRHPVHGLYGGVPDEKIDVGVPDLGISLVSEKGIVGRGVLLDAERYFMDLGKPLKQTDVYRITPAELEAMAETQGVAFQSGDILLLRTGWSHFYTSLSDEERKALPNYALPTEDQLRANPNIGNPGLDQSDEMLAFLWDHHFSLIASDNGGVECYPPNPKSNLIDPNEPVPEKGINHNGQMHRQLLALLGFFLGELWSLEELANDCANDHVYEFFLCSKPLNVIGGVGSPSNAMAIK